MNIPVHALENVLNLIIEDLREPNHSAEVIRDIVNCALESEGLGVCLDTDYNLVNSE